MTLLENFRGFPDPQYTPVPNLLFDSLLTVLSGSQLKVFLAVARRTMGWKKIREGREFVPIAVVQIQAATGLSKPAVIDALEFLREQRLLLRKRQRDDAGRAAVSTYRLRFESDGDEVDDPEEEVTIDSNPRSKNFTLDEEAKVKVNDGKVYLGGDIDEGKATTVKGKEIKKKEEPPTPLQENWTDFTSDPITLVQSLYSRLNHRAKLDNLRARANEPLCGNIRRADTEWGRAEFQSGMESFLADQSDWLREHRWPIKAFLKQVEKYVPSNLQTPSSAPRAGRPAIGRPPDDVQGQAAPVRGLVAPRTDFVQRWNELVPESLVDPALLPKNPKPFSDPLFIERFDLICEKARALIVAGADLKFGFLIRLESGAERYRWQALLADELNWMRPRARAEKADPFAELRKELGIA